MTKIEKLHANLDVLEKIMEALEDVETSIRRWELQDTAETCETWPKNEDDTPKAYWNLTSEELAKLQTSEKGEAQLATVQKLERYITNHILEFMD